jgi:hypothetical protein
MTESAQEDWNPLQEAGMHLAGYQRTACRLRPERPRFRSAAQTRMSAAPKSASPQKRAPFQKAQFNQENRPRNLTSKLFDEADGGARGATRSQEIINKNDPLTGLNSIDMHLNHRFSIFKRIRHFRTAERKLALLADRHESNTELVSGGAAPKMNPRASMPAIFSAPRRARRLDVSVHGSRNSFASDRIGVMSLNMIPGFGKSGTSRTAARRAGQIGRRHDAGRSCKGACGRQGKRASWWFAKVRPARSL